MLPSFVRHYLNLNLNRCSECCRFYFVLVGFLVNAPRWQRGVLRRSSLLGYGSGDRSELRTLTESQSYRIRTYSVWDLWIIIRHTPQCNVSVSCMTCCRLFPSDTRQISNLSCASAIDLTTTICQNSKSASRAPLPRFQCMSYLGLY